MKDLWTLLVRTGEKTMSDKVLRLSAALSYYSLFSLAPLLLIAVAIAGAVFGNDAANGLLSNQLRATMGSSAAETVEAMVSRTRHPADNLIASLFGIVALLIGAGGVFGQLRDAMNTVWGVEPPSGPVLKGFLRERFFSFTMVLGTGFLLLTSLLLSTVLQSAATIIEARTHIPAVVFDALSSAVSFVIVSGLFAAILRYVPDATIEWRDVRFGAVLTALLFTIGKFALGWYLGREATTSVYGSAGSLVLILLWIYYSSLILLVGAEFTQVHARAKGRDIRASNGATSMAHSGNSDVRPDAPRAVSAGTDTRAVPQR